MDDQDFVPNNLKTTLKKTLTNTPPPPNPKPDHLRARNNPILRKKIFSALSDFRFKRMKVVKSISDMPIDSKIHKGETPSKIKEAMQFFSSPASDYVGNSFNPYKKSKNL